MIGPSAFDTMVWLLSIFPKEKLQVNQRGDGSQIAISGSVTFSFRPDGSLEGYSHEAQEKDFGVMYRPGQSRTPIPKPDRTRVAIPARPAQEQRATPVAAPALRAQAAPLPQQPASPSPNPLPAPSPRRKDQVR